MTDRQFALRALTRNVMALRYDTRYIVDRARAYAAAPERQAVQLDCIVEALSGMDLRTRSILHNAKAVSA